MIRPYPMLVKCCMLALIGASGSNVALAQDGAPAAAQARSGADTDPDDPSDRPAASPAANEIVVSADRRRGRLDVEQAPLIELGEEDIASQGVTSIADLVTQITNQTGSARGRGGGRPVILINGIRVGSFREFSRYPPEALERVEVFPEETAQRFGFPPDRRVINLILKENYRNAEVEFEFEGPARGGYHQREQEFGFLQIADGARINLNFEASDRSLLTEDERGIVQTPGSISDLPGDPQQAPFRSLLSDGREIEADVSFAKALIDSGISLSANASYDREDRRSLQGLNTVSLTGPDGDSLLRTFGAQTPLEQRIAVDTFASSGSLTKPVNAFRLTSTYDASLSESEQEIDRRFDTTDLELDALAGTIALDTPLPEAADAGFDIARTRTISGSNLNTIRGPLLYLPGGEVSATFDVGYDWTRLESSDTRGSPPVELTRGDLSTGMNLVIPITSRREGFADALGSFSLTTQIGLQHLSDFGTLGDYTVGLNWKPFDNLDLSATYIEREVAPGLAVLGNPQVEFLNAPVFDFTTGETVLATIVTGGNPDLLAETQRDWKFAANWELPFWENSRFTVEYITNRSDDVTSGFPQVTPEIEAAFPNRITRGPDGTLIEVDRRSVTFAQTRADRLQFSLFTRGSFGESESENRGRQGRGNRGERGNASSDSGAERQGGERPQRFAALRTIACAEDGVERLRALIARIDAGEDVSDDLPGFDPRMAERMLARLRDANGAISDERLEQLRDRVCQAEGGEEGGDADASGRSGGGGGFNPLARRSFSGFRYFISLNHTIELENEILIAPGLAPLNQLDGDATGAFGFPRHNSRLEAGVFGSGIGMRLSGSYVGETRLDGSGLPGSSDLFFGDLARFDIRIFSEIGELIGRDDGVLKDLRLSFRVDNVFDGQRRVVDDAGETPLNYQPFLIDPTGRFIGIDIRKLF